MRPKIELIYVAVKVVEVVNSPSLIFVDDDPDIELEEEKLFYSL